MSDDNVFLVYQLKSGGDTRRYRFESFASITAAGLTVDKDNYNYIYAAPLADDATPDSIYVRYNLIRPEDFAGHSPSVSDVIVMRRDGEATAHYVESVTGFVQVPEFLEGPYKYYSTQRPVDIGTFPKTESGPVKIKNFDKREAVENATFRAWGYVAYDAPLTQKQLGDYELRPASDNPDNIRVSPYQLEAQLDVIGKWEKARSLSDRACITWYHSDMGAYVKKEWVMHEQVADRFNDVVEHNARAAAKRAYRKFPDLIKDGANEVQVVGVWEDMKSMPDNKRYTWHKPSIQGFSLREPFIAPEKLLERYQQAKEELTLADKQAAPKSITLLLTEGAEQAAKDNAARPEPPTNTDRDDR